MRLLAMLTLLVLLVLSGVWLAAVQSGSATAVASAPVDAVIRPTGGLTEAAALAAPTADAQNVELLGQIGGATYAIAVQGDYVYLGVGPRLMVMDVSSPANPTIAV
jgi:hypothetical protein